MTFREIEKLKAYLKLISRKDGLESMLPDDSSVPESAARMRSDGGLEGAEREDSAERLQKAARDGVKKVLADQDLTAEEAFALEAIILPDKRPAIDVVNGSFSVAHKLWTHIGSVPAIRQRLETAFLSIGRIELPGQDAVPYGGTGFVVGEGLLMTNRHVAEIFTRGLGSRNLDFLPGWRAGIDFVRERDRPTGPTLTVRRIVMIHPYWDMALLAVEGLPPHRQPLQLSVVDVRELEDREIAIVGYPAFDRRNDATVQDDLFDRVYGVKRLQPGLLGERTEVGSFGKRVSAVTHDCSTLGGNSGSAVVDLETGEVLALHFGGRYKEANYGVPAFELAKDGRVVDAGVAFAGAPPRSGPAPWSDWWKQADDSEASDTDHQHDAGAATPARGTVASATGVLQAGNGELKIEVPLRISIRLGNAGTETPSAEQVAAEEDAIEKLVEPFRDTDYDSRRGQGYDSAFLGVTVPMPKAAVPSAVAPTLNGGSVLEYQNFSIVMHAKRRLALFTACNVTAEHALRKPDARRRYTRRALTGLGEKDQERWFIDPRMDARFQLPDVFFTRDAGAFDKGHIVRRDDVAWGRTYDLLRRANGDTYHVTNCSPQVAGFNRSNLGDDNWGDLENHVLSEAESERLCVFAGPVLAGADDVFVGAGGGRVKIRAKIPSRFWKVVVARMKRGIAAFAFILEQDLADVDVEFVVADEFVKKMIPIVELEAIAGIRFPSQVRKADQFDTLEGAEVAMRAGAKRACQRREARA